jgi:hypothetical protein
VVSAARGAAVDGSRNDVVESAVAGTNVGRESVRA